MHPSLLRCVSAYPSVCVRVLQLVVRSPLVPDGQSVCMWPSVSAAELRNETPSATLFHGHVRVL